PAPTPYQFPASRVEPGSVITRYGATGGLVDALRRRSGRIPPLCVQSAATPVTSPSELIACQDSRGFSDSVVRCDGFRWHPIRYNAGTMSCYRSSAATLDPVRDGCLSSSLRGISPCRLPRRDVQPTTS